jgi:hypothetical protein
VRPVPDHNPDDAAVDPERGSVGSISSIGSVGSILSIGSVGSVLSIGSAGSILCIGSAGSVLSIGSLGSVLSIGSRGSVISIGSQGMRAIGAAARHRRAMIDSPRQRRIAIRTTRAVLRRWRQGLRALAG